MVIQHTYRPLFNKNSCMRIQFLVSVKDALFHHSNFHLYSIIFASSAFVDTVFFSFVQLLFNKNSLITSATIYTILFSSLQIPLNKDSFIPPASIYTVFLFSFINPAYMYIYAVFPFINPFSFITPASVYAALISLILLTLLRYSFHQFRVPLSKE